MPEHVLTSENIVVGCLLSVCPQFSVGEWNVRNRVNRVLSMILI
jgi:hypothetical protein